VSEEPPDAGPPADPASEDAEARADLERHLADPLAVERDVRARAPGDPVGEILGLFAGLVVVRTVWWTPLVWQSSAAWVVLGALSAWLVARTTARVLRRWRATSTGTPEAAAEMFFDQLAARPGLGWTMLAPTARAREAPAPRLPRRLGPREKCYVLDSEAAFELWATTFGRSGVIRRRWVRHLWTRRLDDGGDVAETESTVWCGSAPLWPVVAAVVVGLGWGVLYAAAAGAVASVATARTAQLRWYLRWIHGSDGRWYLLDWADPEEVVPTYFRS
jgi:hypothetical protein